MSAIKACRCCLATNLKLHECPSDIAAIFEKLCGFPFQSSDLKPKLLCTQCCAGFRNCVKLYNKTVTADRILVHLIRSNIGLTQETVQIVDRQTCNLTSHLATYNVKPFDIVPETQHSLPTLQTDNPTKHEDKKLLTLLTDVKKEIEIDLDHVAEEDNRCDSDSEDDLPLKSITLKRERDKKKFCSLKQGVLRKQALLKGAFKEDYAKVILLTKEQQMSEMLERSHSDNYVNATYKCGDCYKGFLSVNAFQNHVRIKHDQSSGPFVCSMCKCRYATSRQLNTHTYTSHSRRYQCVQCHYRSLTAQKAREHERWHKGYRYDCRLCGQQFRKPSSHLTHVRKAHPSEFICEQCGDSFISQHGLTMHRRKVLHTPNHDDKELEPASLRYCPECKIQFTNRNAWTKHILTSSKHSVDLQNRTSCPICNTKFEFKSELSIHLKSHRNVLRRCKITEANDDGGPKSNVITDVKVNCDVCSAEFNSKLRLRCHVKLVHLGQKYDKNIVCEVCGKHCTSNATLKYHQRTHSGERPFPCSHCPKRFSNRNLLRIHTRTHTDERPYSCDVCSKRFRQKPSLNRHNRVHSGARPYECQFCSKSFTQSNSLKHHVNSVHLKIPRKEAANKVQTSVAEPIVKTSVE